MQKPSFPALIGAAQVALCLLLLSIGSGCANMFYQKADKEVQAGNYRKWENLWDERKALGTHETIEFRRQSQTVLLDLLAQKETAVRDNNISEAKVVAQKLPLMLSNMKLRDPNFGSFLFEQPTLKPVEQLARVADLLPRLVEASHAFFVEKDRAKGLQLACSTPAASLPADLLALREKTITGVVHESALAIRRLGEKGELVQEAEEIASFISLVQTNKLDMRNMTCAADVSSLSSYTEFFDDARHRTLAALEQKSRLFLGQKLYEDAKKMARAALSIAPNPNDQSRLELLQQTILNNGAADYRNQAEKSRSQGNYDNALSCLQKLSALDPAVDVQAVRTQWTAEEKEKRGQELLVEARRCFTSKNFPCAEARASDAQRLLTDPFPARQIWIEARNIMGQGHLKEARRFWEKGNFDAAILECEKAMPILQNPKEAEELKANIKDQKGRQLLGLCRDGIDNGECKTAIKFAREARPLLFNPKEADHLETRAKDCAVRRVAVIVQNKSSRFVSSRLFDDLTASVQNNLQAQFGEYFIVLDASLTDGTAGGALQVAQSAGADYAVVISFDDDLQFSKNLDPGTDFRACTATAQNVYLGRDIYGRDVWQQLFTYSGATVTKHNDWSKASVTMRSYLLDVRQNARSENQSKRLNGSWANEVWRSATDAKYLRQCPCGQWTGTSVSTYFLDQHPFSTARDTPPKAVDLLSAEARRTADGWAREFATALNRVY